MSVDKPSHDLHDFMAQVTREISEEYERIRKRARDDPGTAGDQGEENWAEILQGWLPRKYEVVTKGRIISQDGRTSGQLDILVLKDSYPKKLLNKKLYLAAGVAAAFECKTTLKSEHVRQAVRSSVNTKSLYPARTGSPYRELHSSILFGLLSHSHSWRGNRSTPETNIDRIIRESDEQYVEHPRDSLDVLCVADLASWTSTKMALMLPQLKGDGGKALASMFGPNGKAISVYGRQRRTASSDESFTAIGQLISYMSMRIAWEDASLRPLADYYRAVNIGGDAGGEYRRWDPAIYSDKVRSAMMSRMLHGNPFSWDEWSNQYF